MSYATLRSLPPEVRERVLEARDPRFDGLFVVGLTTSRVYCRPSCPGRRTISDRCRFFESATVAQHAGYRPCRRCRPDTGTPGEWKSAASHLASLAAQRIVSGALNGRSVASLAAELKVSERHLRRALQDEMGVSPIELAQSQRLARAYRLLVETKLSVTRVAFASGFQSLRRFNVVFREQYGMSPSHLRRRFWPEWAPPHQSTQAPSRPNADPVALSIPYRAPLAWETLATFFACEAIPGVEVVDRQRYARTVKLQDRSGYISIENALDQEHVRVQLSASLLPVLPPLLMRVRRLLDLDADPMIIDAHLRSAGLGRLVERRPGVRTPGAFDSFEIALAAILRGQARSVRTRQDLVPRVVQVLGEPLPDTGFPGLQRLTPNAERIADAGYAKLMVLGVPEPSAHALVNLATSVANGHLRLEPGDVAATHGVLSSIDGIGPRLAATILMRTAHWPDASPAWLPDLLRLADAEGSEGIRIRAEDCRPWRAYAAMHWWICAVEDRPQDHGSRVITRSPRTKPLSNLEDLRTGMMWKQRMPLHQ